MCEDLCITDKNSGEGSGEPSEVCSRQAEVQCPREGGQGGVCSFKNSEAKAKVTGNLRRAGWTQGQGKPCGKAESERSQRQMGG